MTLHPLAGDDAELLDGYRRLRDARGFDWGDEFAHDPDDFALVIRGLVPEARISSRTLSGLVDELRRNGLPPGSVLVDVLEDETVVVLSAPMALPELSIRPATVFVRNGSGGRLAVAWGPQQRVIAPAGTAALHRLLTAGDDRSLRIGESVHSLSDLTFAAESGVLRLRSDHPRVWSVRGADGVSWFPAVSSPHWDPEGAGWFVASDCRVGLPEGVYELVVGGRAFEAGQRRHRVEVVGGSAIEVLSEHEHETMTPAPPGDSPLWVGADLHVHRNYSGTDVVDLDQAQAAQDAVGLDVMALVAGNVRTSRVYDHALRGREPARTPEGRLTLFGTEFRNDLYGHLVALGAVPSHAYSGHALSDHPADDVSPVAVAREVRAAGGVAIAAHPFWAPLEHGLPATSADRVRSVEAVYLPVLAALEVLDAVELLSPGHTATAGQVVNRLFDCGFRFALTAGSDTFMSFAAGPTSRPPGDVRCRIGVRGPLNGDTVLDAIRRRETSVERRISAGVEFSQGGREVPLGGRSSAGEGPLTVEIEGPAGGGIRFELLSSAGRAWPIACERGRYRGAVPADAAIWVAVRATATADPDACFHTTPVFLDEDDEPARRSAAQWALAWIENLEHRVGRFARGSGAELQTVFDELGRARAVYELRSKGTR